MADTYIDSKVIIREFDEDRDVKVVGKLERNCTEINGTPKKGFSIFTNMVVDPFSRIRFYPLHIMLVCNYIYIIISFIFIKYSFKSTLHCQIYIIF